MASFIQFSKNKHILTNDQQGRLKIRSFLGINFKTERMKNMTESDIDKRMLIFSGLAFFNAFGEI
ncbi:MAG: hypothetical protein ACI7YS_13660 [Flavobacterium sp.]